MTDENSIPTKYSLRFEESLVVKAGIPSIILDANNEITIREEKASCNLSIDNAGDMNAKLSGSLKIGRSNEGNVRKTLLAAMRSKGISVEKELGDDFGGEDGILYLSGTKLILQIVTVPLDQQLWKSASKGAVSKNLSEAEAVKEIRNAIEKKRDITPSETRKETLLALDAKYFGMLSSANIARLYKEEYDHSLDGFYDIWVVGPTINRCISLTGDI